MNLLEIVQDATAEMGLDSPAGVVSNQSPEVRQLYALLKRLSRDLCRQYDWQALVRENVITTIASQQMVSTVEGSLTAFLTDATGITTDYSFAGEGLRPYTNIAAIEGLEVTLSGPAVKTGTYLTQVAKYRYALPADWRKQINQTEWDRTDRWPLIGPDNSQAWQAFKSGILPSGPRLRFRIADGCLELNPAPANNITLAFEYISDAYVRSMSGVYQTEFMADTDTTIFDPSLLILGLIVKFKQAKGLDVTFELGEFNALLNKAKAQDVPGQVVSLSGRRGTGLLTNANIQDGNFPGPGF